MMRAVRILLLALLPLCTQARDILPFDATSWSGMQHSTRKPLIVLFSTTDCVHCPAAIDGIARQLRRQRARATFAVVVMDGAAHPDAVGRDAHYRKADLVYVFEGEEMALRASVDPGWRGLTPYIALLPLRGEARFHTGALPPGSLDELLGKR